VSERDPVLFPNASRYRAAATRKTGANALLLCYCHVAILELAAQDHRPATAAAAAYRLYREVLLPAASLRLYPVPPGIVVTDHGVFQRHESCLGDSAERVRRALTMSFDQFRQAAGGFDRNPPAAWMRPEELAQLGWLEEVVRRVAHGGELLSSARAAHDQHLGKPRQHRAPVAPDWLAGQVLWAQSATWYALLCAREQQGDGPLWLHGPLATESARPVWSLE
jgi:hypothetical protein